MNWQILSMVTSSAMVTVSWEVSCGLRVIRDVCCTDRPRESVGKMENGVERSPIVSKESTIQQNDSRFVHLFT